MTIVFSYIFRKSKLLYWWIQFFGIKFCKFLQIDHLLNDYLSGILTYFNPFTYKYISNTIQTISPYIFIYNMSNITNNRKRKSESLSKIELLEANSSYIYLV